MKHKDLMESLLGEGKEGMIGLEYYQAQLDKTLDDIEEQKAWLRQLSGDHIAGGAKKEIRERIYYLEQDVKKYRELIKREKAKS